MSTYISEIEVNANDADLSMAAWNGALVAAFVCTANWPYGMSISVKVDADEDVGLPASEHRIDILTGALELIPARDRADIYLRAYAFVEEHVNKWTPYLGVLFGQSNAGPIFRFRPQFDVIDWEFQLPRCVTTKKREEIASALHTALEVVDKIHHDVAAFA